MNIGPNFAGACGVDLYSYMFDNNVTLHVYIRFTRFGGVTDLDLVNGLGSYPTRFGLELDHLKWIGSIQHDSYFIHMPKNNNNNNILKMNFIILFCLFFN